jgi:CheY-like chemotaxis protein
MPLKSVLLVEGLESHRVLLKWALANYGYIVDIVSNAEEALSVFDAVIHDVVVTDQPLGGIIGTEMAHIIKLRSPRTPVVLLAETPPGDQSCIDACLKKSGNTVTEEHLMMLKETLDHLLQNDDEPGDDLEAAPNRLKLPDTHSIDS